MLEVRAFVVREDLYEKDLRENKRLHPCKKHFLETMARVFVQRFRSVWDSALFALVLQTGRMRRIGTKIDGRESRANLALLVPSFVFTTKTSNVRNNVSPKFVAVSPKGLYKAVVTHLVMIVNEQ